MDHDLTASPARLDAHPGSQPLAQFFFSGENVRIHRRFHPAPFLSFEKSADQPFRFSGGKIPLGDHAGYFHLQLASR